MSAIPCKYMEICEKKKRCSGWCGVPGMSDSCGYRPDIVIDNLEREIAYLKSGIADRVIAVLDNAEKHIG